MRHVNIFILTILGTISILLVLSMGTSEARKSCLVHHSQDTCHQVSE